MDFSKKVTNFFRSLFRSSIGKIKEKCWDELEKKKSKKKKKNLEKN